jgi:hypothetical protein
MSKLFAVTGQNNRRNAGKRAVDTEILLHEAQSQPRDSDRYAAAVARMNYLYDPFTPFPTAKVSFQLIFTLQPRSLPES